MGDRAMDASLREQFDRAVDADPGADLGEMAHAAIAEGGRMRRRRRQMAVAGVTAGAAVMVAVVAGVTHRSPAPAPDPAAVAPQMMLVAAEGCSAQPADDDATDVVIVPGDAAGRVTDAMVAQLRSALQHDPRVGVLRFDTHEDAYQRFKNLWSDDPDFV